MKTVASSQPKRKKHVSRVYWPNCAVCQYLKSKPEFRYKVMQSTYFNPQGRESLANVVHEAGDPFPMVNVYAHIKRHQKKDLLKASVKFDEQGNQTVTMVSTDARIARTVEVLDTPISSATTNHELGLDDFIAHGRDKLAKGELSINAATFLSAIKIKADIESKTKDRRLDAIKTFFGGPKKEIDEQPNGGVSAPQG